MNGDNVVEYDQVAFMNKVACDPMYQAIPTTTLGALYRYVKHHIPPGGFLQAVLENDLKAAVARADLHNRAGLVALTIFCANHIPMSCYGSPENVASWLTNK